MIEKILKTEESQADTTGLSSWSVQSLGLQQGGRFRVVCAWTNQPMDGLGPVLDGDRVSHGISPAGEAIFWGNASAWPRRFEPTRAGIPGQVATPSDVCPRSVVAVNGNASNVLAAGGLNNSPGDVSACQPGFYGLSLPSAGRRAGGPFPMQTTNANPPAFVGMLAARVAKITGLSSGRLYDLHSDEMGSPGHFRYRSGDLVYTLRGLRALVQSLDAERETVAARALSAAVDRAVDHRLSGPAPDRRMWWQKGGME